jgi:hypothetical protein
MQTRTNQPLKFANYRTVKLIIFLLALPFFLKANSPLTTLNAGVDATICAGSTHSVTAISTCSGSPSFAWSTSGTGTFAAPSLLSTTYTPSAADITAGTVTLTITKTNGSGDCAMNLSDALVLTIVASPTATAGSPQTICQGGITTGLGGSVGGSATGGTWTSSTNPAGTFSPNANNLNATWTPPPGFSGNAVLTLSTTGQTAPCSAATAAVNVTVNPSPTISVGNAQTICQGGTTTGLGGSVGGGASGGTWTSSTNPAGTFTPNANSLNATWTPPVGFTGNATLTLTTTGQTVPCVAATATVNIAVNASPSVTVGGTQTICQGGVSTGLSGSVGGSATGGTWTSSTNPAGTFSPNANTLNATWTPPAGFSGNAILTLSSTGQSAPCTAATATVNITVKATPTVTVGSSQTICQGSNTASLGGSVGGGATSGTWTSNTNPAGTFLPNANTPNATWSPPAGFSGNAVLTLTTTGMAPCNAVSANVNVSVLATPTVSAGSTQTICQGSITAGLGGSVGGSATGGTWTSSTNPIGTFTPNANTLNATWSPPANFSGNATLTLTTTGMAPCNAVNTNVTITVVPAPTVTTGGPQTICQGGSTSGLGGSISGASAAEWSSNQGGTFSPNATSLNATWTPPVGFNGVATLTLTVTGGIAPCNAVSTSTTISVLATPTANAGTTQTICQGGTTSALNGSVGGSATGGTWTSNSGGTFSNAGSLNSTWTPPGAFSGAAVLTLTSTGMAPCSAVSSTVTITVNPAPTANAGSVQTICQGSTTAPLTGSVGGSATGGTWTSNSGGTFSNANSLSSTWTPPASFFGSATLTLTSVGQLSPCAAANATVEITVLPTPTATTGSAQTICQGSTTAALAGVVGGSANGGTWSSNAGGTFSPNANNLNATWTPPANFSGNAVLTLTTSGMQPCVAATATVNITVAPTPTATTGTTQTICQGETTAVLGGVVGGAAIGGTWSSSTTPEGTFTPNSNALNATWTPPVGFTGTATLTLTTTGMAPCEAISAQVNINVNPNINASVTYPGNPFCQTLAGAQAPVITGVNSGTFASTAGLSINATTGAINPSQSTAGIYTVQYNVPGLPGCPDFAFPVEIVVASLPDAGLQLGSPSFICENGQVELVVNSSIFNPFTNFNWSVVDENNLPIGTIIENNDQSIVYSIGAQSEEIEVTVVLNETIGTCSVTSEIPLQVRVNPETCGFFELAGDVLAACSEVGSFYQWGCGTVPIAGATSNSFVHTAFSQLNSCTAFWVQVSIYSDYSCPVYLGDASQITGIEDEHSSELLLYPNPASGLITISFGQELLKPGTIEIYSYDGKHCLSANALPGTHQQTIDISNLSSGSYVLSLMQNEGRVVKSFVVSK